MERLIRIIVRKIRIYDWWGMKKAYITSIYAGIMRDKKSDNC